MWETRWRQGRGLLAVAALALAGCAGADGERRVAQELDGLRADLEAVRRAPDPAAAERARLADAVQSLDARAVAARDEAAALRAEVDRLRAGLEETRASVHQVQTALDDTLRRLVELAAAPPPAPPLPVPPPVRVAAPAPPPPGPGPEKLFASAMQSFRNDEHGQAVLEFGEVIQRFPQHPLAASAQYWIGEAYYRQRDYRQALVEFQKVEEVYPRGREVPDALLRLGLCHRAIRDTAGARQVWQRLAAAHPGSPAASTARALLSGLAATGGATR